MHEKNFLLIFAVPKREVILLRRAGEGPRKGRESRGRKARNPAGRISSAVEHFTRNEGVPSSNLGFGSQRGEEVSKEASSFFVSEPSADDRQAFFVAGERSGPQSLHSRSRKDGTNGRSPQRPDATRAPPVRTDKPSFQRRFRPASRDKKPSRDKKEAARSSTSRCLHLRERATYMGMDEIRAEVVDAAARFRRISNR